MGTDAPGLSKLLDRTALSLVFTKAKAAAPKRNAIRFEEKESILKEKKRAQNVAVLIARLPLSTQVSLHVAASLARHRKVKMILLSMCSLCLSFLVVSLSICGDLQDTARCVSW